MFGLRRALCESPSGYFHRERAAQIEYLNSFFLELVGYEVAEVLGKDWFELFVPGSTTKEKGLKPYWNDVCKVISSKLWLPTEIDFADLGLNSSNLSFGYSVITAASGKEGLALAIAEEPDAILLDVMMPEMDGAATFAQLQSHPTTKNIPTILLTAKAQVSEQQQFIDLGVTGLITKPFEAMDLVEQIRKILNW